MSLEEVKIELTNYCKRGCIHCSSDANMENVLELDNDIVKKVVDECSSLGVDSIVLTGGEATEYRDIENVIKYIKNSGIARIKLYTMCEPTIEKYELLVRLVELGLTEVIYSLTIPLTTDGVLNYDNVTLFLSKLSDKVRVSFHYCLTTKTVDDIDRLEDIVDSLNYDNFGSLSFLRYVEHGRGKDDLVLSGKELIKLRDKILFFIEKYGDKIHLGSPFNILDITYTPCIAGESNMIIGFNGRAYPCDAMKYFEYLGSGGDIYNYSLEEIYNSSYFDNVRSSSRVINDNCINCSREKCQGGCLAQKMLDIVKRPDVNLTLKWYQENAFRTKNDFDSREMLHLNAYTGIIGEYGEFFDYIKKFYTHGLLFDNKEMIKELAPYELGDLVWYLSVSLAYYYDYTLDEVYDGLLNRKNSRHYNINKNLIESASMRKDPLCPFYEEDFSYDIDFINNFIDVQYEFDMLNENDILKILIKFKKKLNELDDVDTRDDVIRVVGDILLDVASISKMFFDKNFSEVLGDNIEKLKKRFPEKFDYDIANARIESNKKYKEESLFGVKRRILSNK